MWKIIPKLSWPNTLLIWSTAKLPFPVLDVSCPAVSVFLPQTMVMAQ